MLFRSFSGGLGAALDLTKVSYRGKEKRDDFILFSESNTRFLVEIEPRSQKRFEQLLKGAPHALIGKVKAGEEFLVKGSDEQVCLRTSIYDLKESWQRPLRF